MKANINGLLPNASINITHKVLLLEVYFLLKAGKSPAYFSLPEFVKNYSVEVFYIAVFFSIFAAWLFFPALSAYYIFFSLPAWFGRKFMSLYRYAGFPVFEALKRREEEDSVSLSVAKDYAKSKADGGLQTRIKEYETISDERLANEYLASANFVLVALVAWISHSTGAPNFLMSVSRFADPFTHGAAYQICLVLLLIQGIIGRASNFGLLRAAGELPPDFFKSGCEKERVAAWRKTMVEKNVPLAEEWMSKD